MGVNFEIERHPSSPRRDGLAFSLRRFSVRLRSIFSDGIVEATGTKPLLLVAGENSTLTVASALVAIPTERSFRDCPETGNQRNLPR